MKIENQVCSIDLAKRLKELGVKQESLWYWDGDSSGLAKLKSTWMFAPSGPEIVEKNHDDLWSAFTVAELGEMLPPDTPSDKAGCYMSVSEEGDQTHWDEYEDVKNFTPHIVLDSKEADARAKMLIYLLEKELVKPLDIKNCLV